ncbi:Na+/H+ antiporter subunit E [Planktosalinus lacus]|uniref:Cation:proton antiporter n=1 Tax=Planktosalinus lacus TaxID=1526573 RepID=A0A8J2VBV0_9FLAO|nr:Na+/H+ antiporter subunit E [Planktosalinus lacus]GGD96238.1 cation:proton antiporter [Planktosalinus lacus]
MRSRFLSNILLTFIWVALTGSFDLLNFVFGFVLSFLILWVITLGKGESKYFKILPKMIAFFFFFLYELFKANLQVAYDVITPKFYMKPGIIKVPLDAKTDLEITLLANLISLTPGTLSLDVSNDKKVLYVHGMYVSNKEKFIQGIKQGFEKRLLEILR